MVRVSILRIASMHSDKEQSLCLASPAGESERAFYFWEFSFSRTSSRRLSLIDTRVGIPPPSPSSLTKSSP
jgi:hypothetical protein